MLQSFLLETWYIAFWNTSWKILHTFTLRSAWCNKFWN